MSEYRDVLGRELEAGDYILYAVRLGNNPALNVCKILELTHKSYRYDPKRVIPALKVISADYGPLSMKWDRPKSRPGVLEDLDRAVKIEEPTDEIREIFE